MMYSQVWIDAFSSEEMRLLCFLDCEERDDGSSLLGRVVRSYC